METERALPEKELQHATESSGVRIPDRMYFRIGEVAELLHLKPYVLRYWETEFPFLKPKKNSTGQRVYRRTEVESILLIRHLLHIERYSIEGAKLRLRELRGTAGGVRAELETKVLGGAERMRAEETLKETRTVAVELKELLRRPIREIFKI